MKPENKACLAGWIILCAIAAMVTGAFLYSVPLGCVVLGLGLGYIGIAIGWAAEKQSKNQKPNNHDNT